MPPYSKKYYLAPPPQYEAKYKAHENKDDEEDSEEEEEEEEEQKFGWGSCRPRCLQVFNSIRWFVFWTSVFSLFQGFTINGITNAVISSLETRFELPSSKSGLIVSANDFFALFLVLVVSYYGSRRNKPKLIAAGIITLAIGSFVFSLPHFITDLYNYSATDVLESSCTSLTNVTACDVKKESSIQNYVYVFILGNALHGAGSTPMFTLGTAFIDENTKAKMTSLYLGIVYAAASLGVAAGYTVGGQFLSIYTDADRVDTATVDLTPADPRWVGAWWIGFLISGAVMFIIAIPMAGYPTQLPGSAAIQATRKSEAYRNDSATGKEDWTNWRDFPKAMWNLMKNPTFLFLSLASSMGGLAVSGLAAFGPKFLQEQFNLPAGYASMIMGAITVPGAGGGMFMGGYVVKKMNLKCRGIIRFIIVISCLALVVGGLFLIQCPKPKMAGVTVEYVTLTPRQNSTSDLTGSCNSACFCSARNFEPVCGNDDVIYFSPCHAGCSIDFDFIEGPMGPMKMYKNCSCVTRSMQFTNMTDKQNHLASPTDASLANITNVTADFVGAVDGICKADCYLLYVVAPLLFLGMLLTFTVVSPLQTATLRCVPPNQRSLAVGFQWLFLRLGGTTPGPLMLGTIMDSACSIWQDVCGITGSCWIYEKSQMGVRIFLWWISVKGLAVVFFFLAQYVYKAPPEESDEPKDDKTELQNGNTVDRESVL